jgi:hypothetical protein
LVVDDDDVQIVTLVLERGEAPTDAIGFVASRNHDGYFAEIGSRVGSADALACAMRLPREHGDRKPDYGSATAENSPDIHCAVRLAPAGRTMTTPGVPAGPSLASVG